MKLISTFISKKTLAIALLLLTATISNARVFWNKFEASLSNDNTVVLTWNVTEYNNKSFRVQHSIDGIKWENIAIIQSKNSAESMTDYSYTHNNKLKGKQFYRLQDIDVDQGSTGFSPVKTLILKIDKPTSTIWPNPATNYIAIANNDNNNLYTKASILNMTGKVIIEKKLSSHINEITINELPAGIYIIKIENDKGSSYSQKIVKQ